jgi:hypothetical protein
MLLSIRLDNRLPFFRQRGFRHFCCEGLQGASAYPGLLDGIRSCEMFCYITLRMRHCSARTSRLLWSNDKHRMFVMATLKSIAASRIVGAIGAVIFIGGILGQSQVFGQEISERATACPTVAMLADARESLAITPDQEDAWNTFSSVAGVLLERGGSNLRTEPREFSDAQGERSGNRTAMMHELQESVENLTAVLTADQIETASHFLSSLNDCTNTGQ